MIFKVAFASDDGNNMVNKHFGDADFYMIDESGLKSLFYFS